MLILLLLPVLLPLYGQEVPAEKKIYFTQAAGSPLKIDGRLNDPAWDKVKWGGGDFIVNSPNEGEPASEKTTFKILYDARNLYVGIRAYDAEPEKIVRQLSRRDGFEGDWVEINIDSYFDHRTAFSFTITAAGVRGDEFISQNGENWDSNWDPVWRAKTALDSLGWTAEMAIPFSQLRFGEKDEQVWGIQFTRRYYRKNERSNWQ
ncbi:MAG: carbohydrate binding family 9 domain-containing protein, partial [Calditrichaeota bacterium]|nr:carbohydrate binding family 9 domain-containing protein [Calditrichota bacterium]